MASISSILLVDFDAELANTRRLLERMPIEHANWKPHDKSFALGALASHVATLPKFGLALLTSDEMDLSAQKWPKHEMHSAQQLVETLDQHAGDLRTALQSASDEYLQKNWSLRFGEQTIASAPRMLLYRTMYFNHQIHHRAQLTVYLRELNVPVPGLYGPSADEPFQPK